VVGNISVESGGMPNRVQGAGTKTSNNPADAGDLGWGLIQWTPGKRVIGYAEKAGVSSSPIYAMDTQLQILLWHMKNDSPTGAKNMLEGFTQSSIIDAVYYYERKVEGAGKPAYSVRTARATIALEKYEPKINSAYSGTDSTSSDTSTLAALSLSSNGCAPTSDTSGGFAATVEKYVWPYEWRSGKGLGAVTLPGTTSAQLPTTAKSLTAAYGAAIAKANHTYFDKKGAKSSTKTGDYKHKLYTGYADSGVDCGGFVTRLVQDSGLDPYYNMVDAEGTVYNGYTKIQEGYLLHSKRWQAIESGQPSSYYKPGDVAMQDSHTLIFVGEISTFWPVKGGTPVDPSSKAAKSGTRKVLLASASLNKRAPMADKDEKVGSSAYTWYRYVGSSSEKAY
jgi:hypothetical protein